MNDIRNLPTIETFHTNVNDTTNGQNIPTVLSELTDVQ